MSNTYRLDTTALDAAAANTDHISQAVPASEPVEDMEPPRRSALSPEGPCLQGGRPLWQQHAKPGQGSDLPQEERKAQRRAPAMGRPELARAQQLGTM